MADAGRRALVDRQGNGDLVKFQLLQSTIDEDGRASLRQHLACLVVNDAVAIDAGSLAIAATDEHRQNIRDIVLTHAHLDHIAGLPLFIDDLFASLDSPVRIHATREVIEILETNIFNWSVYPRFSELRNSAGPVIEYVPFDRDRDFQVGDLSLSPLGADHKVPSTGFIVSDGSTRVAISGDTATLVGLGEGILKGGRPNAILVECAFPDEMHELAAISHHMTPSILRRELSELDVDCPILVVNIKPMYRDAVVDQLEKMAIDRLEVMKLGKAYFW